MYADYYPNGEIIERLVDLFRRAGADVSVSRVSHFNDLRYFIGDISDLEKKKTIIDAMGSEKRRNFLGYSRIQPIIAQFVLGKVCICKIHV